MRVLAVYHRNGPITYGRELNSYGKPETVVKGVIELHKVMLEFEFVKKSGRWQNRMTKSKNNDVVRHP